MGIRASFRHPRYEVVRLLGEGGMGRVHLARDLLDGGREVALKVYPARANDERLKREFLALRDLRHPGVARALHFGVSRPAGAPFFTLEFIAGAPLGAYLDARAGRAPSAARTALAVRLFTAVAAAAAYVHRRGVLHLDLKPDNILIVDAGEGTSPRPVLIDFGLVHAARSAAPVAHATLPFAPPETFLGEAPTSASDVYSLGVTFYRVLSGRYPVEGSDAMSMARAHRAGAPAPIPESPPALAKVILRALAKDPGHRYRDGGELHAALLQHAVAGLASGPDGEGIVFHEPEFVGRVPELEALAQWLDRDRRHEPVFEVRGEAGMGKSRFLDKAETLIEMQGKHTVSLRAPFGGSGSIADLLGRHLDVLGAAGRPRKRPGAGREVLAAQVIASRLIPHVAADTFIIVDDMEAAGRAGEDIVEAAARLLGAADSPPGGGVIIARRPRDASDRKDGGGADPTPRGIDLGPFALGEALQVDLEGLDGVLSCVPPEEARRLKTEIHRQVGGHPLFYVRGLLDLAGDPEAAVQLAPTERVLARVRRLDDLEREAAVVLASLERPAALAEVSGILGLDPGAAAPVLERLRRAGILADLGRHARIIHSSVEKAILDDLEPSIRRDAHHRIASFLAGSKDRVRLAEGAWHLFQSGDEKAAVALAARSISGGAPIPPSHDAKVVPALLRAADAAGTRTGPEGDFLEAAGDVLEALGRFEECSAVRARLAGTPPITGPMDATTLRRSRKLGSVHHRAGRADLALAVLGRLTTPDAARIVPLEALKARAELALLHHFRGDAGAALEHAGQGIEIWRRTPKAERTDALQSAVDLHGIIGQVSIRRLDLETAIRHFRDGLRLAERTRSPANLSLLLNNLALANHLAGRFGTALATFERAEAAAREIGDHAALVSIRLNIVQILAKQGRFRQASEALDSIESTPAATQSKRLRLVCLHTRGLLLSLLRAEAGEVWSSVEALAAEVNDGFLARFARVYRAEDSILRGDYSAARHLLAREATDAAEPAIRAMKAARMALLEAIAGRAEAVTGLLTELDLVAEGSPAILRAWNDLHAGTASMEVRGWADARARLSHANRVFRATGFAAGEIECALTLADLELRSGGERPAAVKAAIHNIAAARRVRVEAPAHASPRSLEARAAILEARALLLRGATATGPTPARLPDLLSRAAGDRAATFDADLKMGLEVLSAAHARLAGNAEKALDGTRRIDEARAEVASRLDAPDAAAWLERDPWERFGLTGFRPPPGEPRLEPSHAEKLRALLLALGEGTALGVHPGATGREGALQDPLVLVAEGAGAASIEVLSRGKVIARRRAAHSPRKPAPRRSASVLLAPARLRGATVATIRLVRHDDQPAFSAGDEAFLAAAAGALAPHIATELGAAREGGGTAPDHLERTAGLEKTAGLPAGKAGLATRRLEGGARKTQAIAEILRRDGVIASGREMQKVLRAVRAYAAADMPVLITGESGTGKNVFARMLHRLSRRADGPFVVQSASAMPPDLFEADLFGYEKGAFTGAERTRTGFLFQAGGGIFHLEEIGDLEVSLQQRLLRVIEEREVRPLGASAARGLDVRFIVSTQRDIDLMVRRGEFRKDLFFRLGAARIHLPPLRQRLDEVPELVRHHWKELTGSPGRFPSSVLQVFQAHDWPGNIRELISVLRRLSLEVSGHPRPGDVEAALGKREERRLIPPALFRSLGWKDVERALQESYLEHLFEKHAGDLAGIAAALGTTTRSIYRRFERLGIRPGDLRRKG